MAGEEEEVQGHKSAVADQELDVADQELDVTDEELALEHLESAVADQELALEHLESAVADQESVVSEQKLALKYLKSDIADLESAVSNLESAVAAKISAADKKSADKQTDVEPSHSNSDSIRVDPEDGTVYEWDSVQRGWFPQLNEDMIAAYTMSYGSADRSEADGHTEAARDLRGMREKEEREVEPPSKKVKKEAPTWFEIEESQNKHVYVSNLPSSTTEQQFIELMRKCGVIAEHADGRPRVKLYRTEGGEPKGDALCTYLKVESVPYAELILDGYEVGGHKIRVQTAVFEMKGEYNASLKPKKNKKNKKNRAEKLVKWKEPIYDRPKHERVVILKNVFSVEEMAGDPLLSEQVRLQIKSECEKCGKIKKAIVCERQLEGVVSVMFISHEDADRCVQVMHGRSFGGRIIECSLWDGEAPYVAEETEEERKDRLEHWEEYLRK